MTRADSKTTILDDGLRYKSKAPGSPFVASTSMATHTMSCLLCGRHRSRELLFRKLLFGRMQQVCRPNCKAVEAYLAGNANALDCADASS